MSVFKIGSVIPQPRSNIDSDYSCVDYIEVHEQAVDGGKKVHRKWETRNVEEWEGI